MKTLQCGCCGERTKGKQHWNQDTGYGLCPRCVKFLIDRSELDELKGYGKAGVNFAAPLSRDCPVGALVFWDNADGSLRPHFGTLKEWDNGTAIIREMNELDETRVVSVRAI